MSQVGRISGPLLTENLERNGTDLAFRNTVNATQLLYLDVNNNRLAVNGNSPTKEIDISGKTRTPVLLSSTASLADLNIETNNISTLLGNIFLNAENSIRLSNFETDNIRITNNVISSFNSNSNIELRPNGTGNTEISSDMNVTGNIRTTGNLDVMGNVTIGGNITIGDENTDTVEFNTEFSQSLEPDVNGLYNLGSQSKKWDKAWISEALVSDIQIKDNFIATTESNTDLELIANSTGRLYIGNNDVKINNRLNVSLISNLQSLNIVGTMTHLGNRNITLSSIGIFDGNFILTEGLTVGSFAQFENIRIQGNKLSSTNSNSNLNLRANNTGLIYFSNNNVELNQSLSVTDIIGVDINLPTKTLDVDNIFTGSQIRISDNVITTTLSNSDLELKANGTGVKRLEDILFLDNKIYTEIQDLNLNLNENIIITSTKSIQLPKGTTAQRTLTASHIRFNTTDNAFEGFGNVDTVTFNGIYSSNRSTSVLANKAGNFIDITIDNTKVGEVNSNGLEIHALQVDDVFLSSNVITTSVSNSNLELLCDGAGRVVIDNIRLSSSQIYNTVSNGNLTFSNTGNGYTKIAGTLAVAIPNGTVAERRSGAQIGETRWNTEDSVLETYDGAEWVVSAGEIFIEDISNEWSLILG